MIRPELAALAVPIVDLRTHPQNPRKGNVMMIAESLKAFGQMRPIVVQRSTMQVVAGNHTYLAAIENGWSEIAAIVLDLDDADALRYLLADNRSSDFATYDEAALADVLRDLSEIGALEGTGWTGDELDDLLRDISAMETLPPEPEPTMGADPGDPQADTAVRDVTGTCPKCGERISVRAVIASAE